MTGIKKFRPINVKAGLEPVLQPGESEKTDLTLRVEAALKEVNETATAHTFTDARDIFSIARKAEDKLEKLGIPKAGRAGARVEATSGDACANAYKFPRWGTRVALERRPSGWWLVRVSRATIFLNGGGADHLQLTKEQDEKAVAELRKRYSLVY